MLLDRRRFLTASFAWMATSGTPGIAGAPGYGAFWKVAPPRAAPSILFGYDVVAAAAAPNLLATGERLAEPTRHLILDMPAARFPSKRVELQHTPPLVERYGPETAQKLLDVLRTVAPQWQKPDILPGNMIVLLLSSEGRTPNGTGDTLPASLFARVFQTGEMTSYLVSLDEVIHKNSAPDLATEPPQGLIAYLLDLRAKRGPLGKYTETLYVQERLYELWRFHLDLHQRGFSLMPNLAARMETLAERAVVAIRTARKPTFLMIPSDNFVRDDGILARLERAGVAAEPAG